MPFLPLVMPLRVRKLLISNSIDVVGYFANQHALGGFPHFDYAFPLTNFNYFPCFFFFW